MAKKKGMIRGTGALAVLCLIYAGVVWYTDTSQEKIKQQAELEKIYVTDLPAIKAISYDYDGTELSFTKNGDSWNYDGDPQFPVLQSKISAIAETSAKLPAIRMLEDGDGPEAYGLSQPARKVTVTAEDESTQSILIGSATEDGNYYARLDSQDTVYLISSKLFDETSYGLNEVMELEQFPIISGTNIRNITMERDGEAKDYMQSDSEKLDALAASLSGLAVKSCVNYKVTEAELSRYGLELPEMIITYTYNANGVEETLSLSVGSMNEDGTGYYTKKEGSKMVNVIDKAMIDECADLIAKEE